MNPATLLPVALLLAGTAFAAVPTMTSAPAGCEILRRGDLAVALDREFPRAVAYERAGATLDGQKTPVAVVEINGARTPCVVAFARISDTAARYTLDFPETKASVVLGVAVEKDAVVWRVEKVEERGAARIRSFAFPGDALLSSADPAATFAALHATHRHHHNPEFRERFGTLAQTAPVADDGNLFFLASGKLAAGIGCDNFHDIRRAAFAVTDKPRAIAAQNPEWQLRAFDDEKPFLPSVRVFVTGDLNGDGKADWQDAAVAMRRGSPMPFGHETVKDMVAENIAMNFASGAQQPFLKILDEIKKCALVTDGLGQTVTIKGFSSEGHDSANSDLAGHWNERAGGLADLTTLLAHAGEWNARVGIHINAWEVYPEAHRYDPALLRTDAKGNPERGWTWLDHSYHLDTLKDARSGAFARELEAMRRALPNLGFVYLDTYWDSGWPAWKTAEKMRELRIPLHTEGCLALAPWTVWAHWRDRHSVILEFLWFSDRDLAPGDAILRGGRNDSDGFMGWQNRHSFGSFVRRTFVNRLPAKWLQHFELLRHEPGRSAEFSGGVKVVKSGDKITVTRNGNEVMEWNADTSATRLLAPWNDDKKLYAWDAVGGAKEWTLPPQWKNLPEVFLYRLTDLGRTGLTTVPVKDGKVTLTLEKNAPFVVYPAPAPAPVSPRFGEGGPLADPGFDSQNLAHWTPSAPAEARIEKDGNGNPRLLLSGKEAVSVSQTATGLTGGKTYAFSVWAQGAGRRVEIEVRPLDASGAPAGPAVANYADKCDVKHAAPNDPRGGTRYQRLRVLADLPAGCTQARVTLKAGAGDAASAAEFDDARVVVTARSPEAAKHTFWEDFEHVETGGYGFFTCCPNENTHLSEANPPYTRDTISGKFSLKSRAGFAGRTLPSTLRLKPGTTYTFSCKTLGRGRLTVVGDDGKTIAEFKFRGPPTGNGLPDPHEKNIPDGYTPRPLEGSFTTGPGTESFLSLSKDGGDFIAIDDIAIDEAK